MFSKCIFYRYANNLAVACGAQCMFHQMYHYCYYFLFVRVEQELMARMISEMTTRQQTMPHPQARDPLESADSSMVSSTSSQPSMGKPHRNNGIRTAAILF